MIDLKYPIVSMDPHSTLLDHMNQGAFNEISMPTIFLASVVFCHLIMKKDSNFAANLIIKFIADKKQKIAKMSGNFTRYKTKLRHF